MNAWWAEVPGTWHVRQNRVGSAEVPGTWVLPLVTCRLLSGSQTGSQVPLCEYTRCCQSS
jgi:hypothetical protein